MSAGWPHDKARPGDRRGEFGAALTFEDADWKGAAEVSRHGRPSALNRNCGARSPDLSNGPHERQD